MTEKLVDQAPRPRADHWRLRTRLLPLGSLPILMGIVNVTPDSFSDGGLWYDQQAAIEQALRLVAAGAHILDIGGESTRPYATPVSVDEELGRVMPVLEALRARVETPLSIDTSKARVAREALAVGVEIINDISGLTADASMVDLAVESGAGICAMHMQGTPRTMQDAPTYVDVVGEIHDYLRQRRDHLLEVGIAPDRICLDPGIGFGKTHHHNLTLLANCHRYHDLGCPLLVGHSRKGFIGKVLGDPDADRIAGSVGVALALATQGVQVLRVHDVAQTYQALCLFAAAGGLSAGARGLSAGAG